MMTFLNGVPDVIVLNGTVDALSVDLTPPSGEIWVILAAVGLHDDTASVTCRWSVIDGTDTFYQAASALGADTRIPLYAILANSASNPGTGWLAPLTVNEKVHARLSTAAIGSGKKLIIQAVVLKYRGFGTWVDPV
jgi:hypothetical protein